MEKEIILSEIRRLAAASHGKAPGSQKLQTETGIRKSDWYPRYWVRWSDAVEEAGLTKNELTVRLDSNLLIEKYISLIRELKRVPVEGELRVKRTND